MRVQGLGVEGFRVEGVRARSPLPPRPSGELLARARHSEGSGRGAPPARPPLPLQRAKKSSIVNFQVLLTFKLTLVNF